ncbi:MAG TPA: hemolysin family protein [Pyrinomonadaceae bacterium]|jgi:putative hemolysin
MEYLVLEVLLIVVLLLINGTFSMSELAVVSARKLRLQRRAEDGDKGAQAALELAAAPDNFLSTVQIGITLVGVLAGAFGGAGIAVYLTQLFQSASFSETFAETISFVIVVSIITYFSVVVGELIPKSIALNYPERIASFVARPMRFISLVASPIVWFLSAPTGLILRFFKVHAVVDPPITDDEIKGMIAQGTEAGVFEETEQDLIESVIHLGDQRITALMTPRLEICWINIESSAEAVQNTINESTFSRFPVGRGTVDNIIGYVAAKYLLKQFINGEAFNIERAIQKPLYVPETITALELLEKFKNSHTHLAIIIDEFGATEGLITMNDVLEAIVGELATNAGIRSDNGIIEQKDGSFIFDGRTAVDEFTEALKLKELPNSERGQYETIAGFVLTHLGRVPSAGESFEWRGYRFLVAEMQRNRIVKVIVSPMEDKVI